MKKRFLMLAALLPLCLAAVAQVPNPYTYNDVPDNASEVPVGLPAHDENQQPGMQRPRPQVSFCAYRISNHGTPAKVFYNAANRRQYSVSSGINPATGEMQIIKTLTIPDSLAVYRIDDAARTITKMPGEGMQAVAEAGGKVTAEEMTEEEMVYNSDRWCYMKTIVTSEEEEHYRTSFIDPETGITLCEDADGIVTFMRNIHLGVPYPEVFELPQGYTFVVQDLSSGVDAYKQFEERMKATQQQLEGMNGSGASALEQLLNQFRNK